VTDRVGQLVHAHEDAAFGVGRRVAGWMRTPSKPGTFTSSGSSRPKCGECVTITPYVPAGIAVWP
jgi:hypothetical protein